MNYVGMDNYYIAWKEEYFEKFTGELYDHNDDAENLGIDILKCLDKMTGSNLTLYLLNKYGNGFAEQIKKDYLHKITKDK